MSDTEFTQGPWEVDYAMLLGFKDTLAIYHRPNGSTVTEIIESPDEHNGECIHGNSEGQRLANARLIAAAPELYEALEEVKRVFIPCDEQQKAVISLVYEVLKKARGE